MRRRSFVMLPVAGLLAGCGGDGDDGDPLAAPSGPIVLGFSQVGSESGWRLANTKSIQKSARNHRIELKFDDAGGSQERQVATLQSFIDARVSVIAFSPVVEEGWDDVLRRARSAGIPVVLTDRSIKTADDSLYVSWIGADFLAEGNQAALYLSNEFPRSGGPVKVVEILGATGSSPANLRAEGFASTAGDDNTLQIVDREPGDWSRTSGEAAMRKLIQRNPDIDAVFAHNDDMGLGAAAVLENSGRRPGTEPKLVTVDATRAGLQALIDGRLNYVVESSPIIGELLMRTVVDLFHGGDVPKRIASEIVVFDKASATEALPDRLY